MTGTASKLIVGWVGWLDLCQGLGSGLEVCEVVFLVAAVVLRERDGASHRAFVEDETVAQIATGAEHG
jgi:hypothetical protein